MTLVGEPRPNIQILSCDALMGDFLLNIVELSSLP